MGDPITRYLQNTTNDCFYYPFVDLAVIDLGKPRERKPCHTCWK
jgi:hypothetical protein